MTNISEKGYFIRRARQSRHAAKSADTHGAWMIHSQLASAYDAIVERMMKAPVEKLERPRGNAPMLETGSRAALFPMGNCPAMPSAKSMAA